MQIFLIVSTSDNAYLTIPLSIFHPTLFIGRSDSYDGDIKDRETTQDSRILGERVGGLVGRLEILAPAD